MTPMDCSLPGSSVPGVYLARMLAWVAISYSNNEVKDLEKEKGTWLVVQWLKFHIPNAGGLGLIPGQGIRSHMMQLRVRMPHLKIPHATARTWCSQINEYILEKERIS